MHVNRDTGQPSRQHPPQHIILDTQQLSNALHHASASTTHSPLSTPATPSLRNPLSRRPSQAAAASPNVAGSPRPPNTPLRRPSSSASLHRAPSSPRLARKGSRQSLGGTPDEQERRPTPKRSISNLVAGLRDAQTTMESIEEPEPLTATHIAEEHFTRELLGHARIDADAETVVILHDACYGHRFSRLKTTKSALSMIVERPERIHASILGASTAYVRLGGHHAAGKQAPHPDRNQLTNPPFKIRRSGRSMGITSQCVTNVHGTEWMSELQGMCRTAPEKLAAGTKELTRASPDKVELHQGDLYLANESLEAFQGALGGVADAVDTVFAPSTKTKRAFVAVRPPGHHCSADLPSGFCWLNNVHVGIEYAALEYGLTHAVILDFDLHHGDGSQSIAWERNSQNNVKRTSGKPTNKMKFNPDIGYYSLHDINSYPCEMGDDEKVQAASLCIENAHGQSIWNVHLQEWKTEADFWKLYESRYRVLLDKAQLFLEHHSRRLRAEGRVFPKTAIFISAGFDASEWEGAGMQRHKVNVPTEFYARFTQDVVKLAGSIDGCDGRVISVLEGGYSDRALCSGVLSHLSGLCATPITPATNGFGALMEQMGSLSINGSDQTLQYDKDWWSAANLTALENKVNPPPPPQAKKGRTGPQPTYATPTESFAYKVINPQKFARSISGTMREAPAPVRPPTPPPPEVDWVVATQELSKLLIPTQRQTRSFTPDELALPRVKQERQSAGPVLSTAEMGKPRQLRDRKAKGPAYAESAHSDEFESVRSRNVSRAESRSSRRETIATLPTDDSAPAPHRRASRRLSAGSALGALDSPVDTQAPPMPALPLSMKGQAGVNGPMKPPPLPVPNATANNKKVRAPSKPPKASPPASMLPVQTAVPTGPSSTESHTAPAAGGSSDVDKLTSGMKKITLKVSSTKEEHDRKQKEKLDAERRARALKGAETRRVNAAKKAAKDPAVLPRTQKPAVVVNPPLTNSSGNNLTASTQIVSNQQQNVVPIAPAGVSHAAPILPVIVPATAPAVLPETQRHSIEVPAAFRTPAEELEFPEYTEYGSSMVPPATQTGSAGNAALSTASVNAPAISAEALNYDIHDGSVPYPPTWSNAAVDPPIEAAKSMGIANGQIGAPLSSSRPSSSHNLPVFSSTGHIPFAGAVSGDAVLKNLDQASVNEAGKENSKSIWEVPESPAK